MATRYDTQFKEEALRLVEEVGMTKAADQLGVSPWTIREWRKTKEAYGEQAYVGSGHKRVPPNEKDRIIAEQQKELQELRRANEILKEALGFFAAGRKK